MSYVVGIDLGTTFTAAAVSDSSGLRMVSLAHDRIAIPSIVAPVDDGVLVADEAAAIAAIAPWNVAREFKRRFGDPTPMIVDGRKFSAEQLTGSLLAWVVGRVEEQEGHPADRIVVTHPATWGDYKLDLLRSTASSVGLPSIDLVSEPAAAALNYHVARPVDEGSTVAVYDLGGGTFDVTLLERSDDRFTLRAAGGLERAGGLNLDDAVFRLAVEPLAEHFEQLDTEDPATQRAVARLREECTRAKIGLSYDTRAIIPIVLPGLVTEVLVQRSEFELLIEPLVSNTIDVTQEVIERARIDTHPSSFVLVGGSSRVPIVAQRLSQALGVPVALDTHPKQAVALGAATFGAMGAGGGVASDALFDDSAEAEVQELPTSTVIVSRDATTSLERRQRLLTVLTGPRGGQVIDLPDGATVVGRSDGDDVRGLGGRLVSRRHLEIVRDGTSVKLWDLGSTNGTQVDGVLLGASPMNIEPGTIVNAAGTLLMLDGPGAQLEPVSSIVDSWALPSFPATGLKRRRRRSASSDWLEQLEERCEALDQTSPRLWKARRFERPSAAVLQLWSFHLPGRLAQLSVPIGSVVLGWANLPTALRVDLPDFLNESERSRARAAIGAAVFDPLVPLVVPLLGKTTVVQGPETNLVGIAHSVLSDLQYLSPDLRVDVERNAREAIVSIHVEVDPLTTIHPGSPAETEGWVLFQAGASTPVHCDAVVSVNEDGALLRSPNGRVEFEPATLLSDGGAAPA